MIKWGVGEELVPPSVLHGLQSVDGLRWGRTTAREPEPVKPVDDAVVEATLLHLCPTVADMVRVQRLTGMRPGEVCAMTVGEIDTSRETWIYRPRRHKTSHHGKTRSVPLGPRARLIISRYLTTDLTNPIFSPVRAVAEQKQRQRAENRTPFTPSRLKRDRLRARKPRRLLNRHYTPTNYAQAVRRACEAAGVPAWTPNQLRHSRATELRRDFGLDAAGAVLGHSRLETTQIYAERNVELAVRVAEKTG
jgi:integrase